jgi:CheY-like chemotaxis protein
MIASLEVCPHQTFARGSGENPPAGSAAYNRHLQPMIGTPELSSQLPPMLVVEDSDEDFEAFLRYLKRSPHSIPVYRCVNGDQALAFLFQTGDNKPPQNARRPGLIVLDLNLPGTDGREVLHQIKRDRDLNRIPVIVFTTSNNPKDLEDCHRLGVNGYIVKPINIERLKRDIQAIVNYWLEVTASSESYSTSWPESWKE